MPRGDYYSYSGRALALWDETCDEIWNRRFRRETILIGLEAGVDVKVVRVLVCFLHANISTERITNLSRPVTAIQLYECTCLESKKCIGIVSRKKKSETLEKTV
jgi:hypothetical protein